MSGMEPMFLAEAAAADVGTAALTGEVLGAEALTGGLSALEGAGALGAGTLGAEGLAGLAGTNASVLSAIAPEAYAASQSAIAPALEGLTTPQVEYLTGANTPSPVSGSSLYDLKAPGYEGMNAPLSNKVPSKYALGDQMADYKLAGSVPSPAATATANGSPSLLDKGIQLIKDNPFSAASMGLNALQYLNKPSSSGPTQAEKYSGPLSKFKYDPSRFVPSTVAPPTPYTPVYKDYRAYAGGGAIETMSNENAIGANTGYPMADINKGAYATPYQQPISRNVLAGAADTGVNPITGEMQFAGGGIADLGSYSDGGRMLKGPGDGMSDNIPATIAGKQPARLANEEFVVPADVVSHLGNGSSDAGAKQLYKMMDRVRQARTGKKAQGKQINPDKFMPA